MGKRTATGSANPAGGPDASVPLHEVARYWIEVESRKGVSDFRAGDSVQLESGQRFKFDLSPNENGYIYLIGPGENNAPMIFLSAKPTDRSGLKTNEVRSGLVFSFPADTNQKANFMRLDEKPGTDEFAFVFSPNPISTPAFFAGESDHQLTTDELKEWTNFQAVAKANAASTEVIKTGASPQLAVKVPQNAPENASVVFRVRIEHK